jgi:hypothetical protein
MIRKEIPAGLTITKPMPKAIIAVIIPARGKLNQKEKPNRLAKRADAYAPIPQKAAMPMLINPTLSCITKLMVRML